MGHEDTYISETIPEIKVERSKSIHGQSKLLNSNFNTKSKHRLRKLFQIMKNPSISTGPFIKKALIFILSCTILLIVFKLISSQSHSQEKDDTLIDIPFNFVHLPECNKDKNFLILVHTAPENVERRSVFRRTWASHNETDVDIFFLTGKSQKIEEHKKLQKEILENKNFIQGDFVDSYRNLTYKHVMGLKYVFHHCPHVEYLVKIDDDTFVNIPVLKKFFEMYTQRYGRTKDILCSKRVGHPVLREGKWAVTNEDFAEKTYPPHCLGYAVIYPKSAVELLYPVAQKMKYFWIDDVHVTGSVAKRSGVGQVNIDSLIMTSHELSFIKTPKYDMDLRPVILGPAETSAEDIIALYEFMRVHGKKASVMDYLS